MATNEKPQGIAIPTPVAETREDRRARIASIRSRGAGLDYLTVLDKDPNLHYEWVMNSPLNIMRKEQLGFSIVKERITPASHGNPDGSNVAGDVILMACTKEMREDIEWADKKERERRHGVKGRTGEVLSQLEEKQFDSNADGLSIIEESSAQHIGGKELRTLTQG